MPSFVKFCWVGNSPQIGEIYNSDFLYLPFFLRYYLAAKPDDEPKGPMAQNVWNLPRICLLGILTKNGIPSLNPKFWEFCITKAVFCPKHAQILPQVPPNFIIE